MAVYRIGVFFDGTGGRKDNDINIGDGSQTNIAKLHDLYKAKYDKNSKGTKGEIFEKPFYVVGIGTDNIELTSEQTAAIANGELKKTDVYDIKAMAVGSGAKEKSDKTLEYISDLIEITKGKDPSAQIVVDVYGYSRGAAIARDFVNEFNKKYRADSKDNNTKIDFVGLYDTVASIGTASNLYDGGLNMDLSKYSANKIVQFAARNEYRDNFRLESLADKNGNLQPNMEEIAGYGSHGIGGGDPNRFEDEIVQFCDKISTSGGADDRYAIEEQKKMMQLKAKNFNYSVHIAEQQAGGLNFVYAAYTDNVTATNDLSKAYFYAMVLKMQEHGIDLTNEYREYNQKDKNYTLPQALDAYAKTLISNGYMSDEDKGKVEKYVTSSTRSLRCQEGKVYNDDVIKYIVNKDNGDENRTIYYNEPVNAAGMSEQETADVQEEQKKAEELKQEEKKTEQDDDYDYVHMLQMR